MKLRYLRRLRENALCHLDRLRSVYRYVRAFKRFPNLIQPKRFTDYLLSRRVFHKINDTLLATTADKFAVRDYVAKRVGEQVLTKLYQVCDNPADIDFESIGFPAVFKSTHGSGQILILKDRNDIDEEAVRSLAAKWLAARFPLWYRKIPPRMIIEEFLSTESDEYLGTTEVPVDYKFFVFHGRVSLIVVDHSRFSNHTRSLYNANWEYIDVKYKFPKNGEVPRPSNLSDMVSIAETLGLEFDFVRVDLYDLGNRIVFGEMTHSPDASILFFEPDAFDFWLGGKLSVKD